MEWRTRTILTFILLPTCLLLRKHTSIPSASYFAAISANAAKASRACRTISIDTKHGKPGIQSRTSFQRLPCIDPESSTTITVLYLRNVSSAFSTLFWRIGLLRASIRSCADSGGTPSRGLSFNGLANDLLLCSDGGAPIQRITICVTSLFKGGKKRHQLTLKLEE